MPVDIPLSLNSNMSGNGTHHTKSYVLSYDSLVSEGAQAAVPVAAGRRVPGRDAQGI